MGGGVTIIQSLARLAGCIRGRGGGAKKKVKEKRGRVSEEKGREGGV